MFKFSSYECLKLMALLVSTAFYFQQAIALEKPLEQKPKRIVSTSLASDEILVDLLSMCNSNLNRLKAVSIFADNPKLSNIIDSVKTIKERVHSEPESILKLMPDLVFLASYNSPELKSLIKAQKTPHIILENYRNVDDIENHILEIGKAVSCINESKLIAKEFKQKIASIVTESAKRPKQSVVFFDPDSTVMGKETLFDELCKINNLTNVVSEAGLYNWPRVNPEQLQIWNPKWIVIGCNTPSHCDSLKNSIKKNAAWKNLQAAKSNQFLEVPEKTLQSTSHYFGALIKRP
jgi:iron complex transport system substrate-binding protein